MNVAVLMTCYNRRDKTLACLDALFASDRAPAVDIGVFLVDDASRDGTAEAVRTRFPEVTVIGGTGDLYWNGGMRRAYECAQAQAPDYYLWLNDDTTLYADTLQRMLDLAADAAVIVVGSTRDPLTGELTYGGTRRFRRLRPFTLAKVSAPTSPVRCDTFNGNCVLVSAGAARALGNLDPRFRHAMGDTDYGFRALKLGIPMWVLPGYAGTCAHDHTLADTYHDPAASLAARWKHMMSAKGLPPESWRALTRAHGGVLWWLYWLWPYAKVLAGSGWTGSRTTGHAPDDGAPARTVGTQSPQRTEARHDD
jgi:GT2 family glycosyltransferase